MSCILTIAGRNFDVDSFIALTKLKPYKVSYKGEPTFKTNPKSKKVANSGLSIEVSKGDFNNLNKQVTDTILFLKKNSKKLGQIALTESIDYAVLNFGIDLRIDNDKVLIQSDKFPAELLKLAGDLALDIELSIYQVDLQEVLEDENIKLSIVKNKSKAIGKYL